MSHETVHVVKFFLPFYTHVVTIPNKSELYLFDKAVH